MNKFILFTLLAIFAIANGFRVREMTAANMHDEANTADTDNSESDSTNDVSQTLQDKAEEAAAALAVQLGRKHLPIALFEPSIRIGGLTGAGILASRSY